jgi:peptidoglycan hydrolase-like protein with peptidoglycan-binding domain
MKATFSALILLASVSLLCADPTIENVQQALKDQGFYYGEITGKKNADTTAAIRRYQIRNGLQVTGELDAETLRALGAGNSAHPITKATPSPTPDTGALRSEPRDETTAAGTTSPAPTEPSSRQQPDREPVYPGRPVIMSSEGDGLFAGTPYERAPAPVQRNVVVSAQRLLAERGLYRDEIDGIYGPNMEFSLRAYQARVRLPVTGRLDLETLAALRLLPGANVPIFIPHRRPFPQQPVRGEWIPE